MSSLVYAAKVDSGDSVESSSRTNEVMMADTFPSKAFLAIEYCDSHASDMACWSDDGTNFIVKDTVEFAASHLPRWFKHSNFQSFVRQLNLYGFRTIRYKNDGSSKSDGPHPVVYYNENFQRGRKDLLTNIKRSKKGDRARKNRKEYHVEEKKEDDSSLHRRFDMLQDQIDQVSRKLDQIDQVSRKLDLLINLVNASAKSDSPAEVYVTNIGTKRRRAGSPSSSETGPTSVSDLSTTSQSSSSSHVATSPRYIPNMDVVEEYNASATSSSDTSAGYADLEPKPHNINYSQDTKELQDFVEMMLDDSANDTGALDDQCEVDDLDIRSLENKSEPEDTTMVADELLNKVAPATSEGTQQMPETTVSAVSVVRTDVYDEENGIQGSSLPLTTAVEVTDASILERKWWTGRRIAIFAVVCLVLIAFIVWPVVVYTKDDDKTDRHGTSSLHESSSDSSDSSDFIEESHDREKNETSVDNITDTLRNNLFDELSDQNQDGIERRPGHLSTRNRPPVSSTYQTTQDDAFPVVWRGQEYQCNAVT